MDSHPVDCIQPIYDICMVWPPETQRDEHLKQLAAHHSDPVLVGNRAIRICSTSTSQQYRLHRQRGPVQHYAVESYSGSYIINRIYFDGYSYVQGTTSGMEPFRGIWTNNTGCIFRFHEIIAKKSQKSLQIKK